MQTFVCFRLQGFAPLRVATLKGAAAMVKLVLSHGASVGPETYTVSPMLSLQIFYAYLALVAAYDIISRGTL